MFDLNNTDTPLNILTNTHVAMEMTKDTGYNNEDYYCCT